MKGLFYQEPTRAYRGLERTTLGMAIGALLYIPGDREDIAKIVLLNKYPQVRSIAICLEDAISDYGIKKVIQNVKVNLEKIRIGTTGINQNKEIPLLFIRVRNTEMMREMQPIFEAYKEILTGIIFPKITVENAVTYFQILDQINKSEGPTLYAMPILESGELIYKENRTQKLLALKQIFDAHQEEILNIRLGGTDFCGLFGLRRGIHYTIYDISVIRDCITEILNIFLRGGQYVLSGPVWEYFKVEKNPKEHLKTLELQGLIKEVQLDIENGLIGKTAIHPTQIEAIHALYAVSYENYQDAQDLLGMVGKKEGVNKSASANKMNESRPHRAWAEKILKRAQIYGVYHEGYSYEDALLTPRYNQNGRIENE